MKAFLTGFALAAATNFVVFPVNARKPVFKEMTGMLGAMRGIIKAQVEYMRAYEDENLGDNEDSSSDDSVEKTDSFKHETKKSNPDPLKAREAALRGAAQGVFGLLGKMPADIPFAKREIAFGKLCSQDISELNKKLREGCLPLLGLCSLIDLTRKDAEAGGWEDMLSIDKSKFDALPETEQIGRAHV